MELFSCGGVLPMTAQKWPAEINCIIKPKPFGQCGKRKSLSFRLLHSSKCKQRSIVLVVSWNLVNSRVHSMSQYVVLCNLEPRSMWSAINRCWIGTHCLHSFYSTHIMMNRKSLDGSLASNCFQKGVKDSRRAKTATVPFVSWRTKRWIKHRNWLIFKTRQ